MFQQTTVKYLFLLSLVSVHMTAVAMGSQSQWQSHSRRHNSSSRIGYGSFQQLLGGLPAPAAGAGEADTHRPCPSCHPRSRPGLPGQPSDRYLADMARLETIKRQILVKLGLQSKPNISSTIPKDLILQTLIKAEAASDSSTSSATSTSSLLMDHHPPTNHDDLTDDDFYGKTSEIIAFAEEGPKWNGQILLEFSSSHEAESNLRVKTALLWIYVHLKKSTKNKQRRPPIEKKPTLFIFQVLDTNLDNSTIQNKNLNLELLSSDRVTLSQSGWIKLNLTHGIHNWFSTRHGNPGDKKLRLLIDCSGCGATVEPILTKARNKSTKRHQRHRRSSRKQKKKTKTSDKKVYGFNSSRPFLVIRTESVNGRRLKRRVLDCSQTTRACCKQRFYVSFRALGWDDWIIAPSGYYANYCRGDCGGDHRTPDTFLNYHTHVMDEIRRLDNFPEIQPCCAPTRFSPMSLIYFGPDMNIIKRDLPKMVVEECGCP